MAATLPSSQKLTRCPCRFIRFCFSFPPTHHRSTSDRRLQEHFTQLQVGQSHFQTVSCIDRSLWFVPCTIPLATQRHPSAHPRLLHLLRFWLDLVIASPLRPDWFIDWVPVCQCHSFLRHPMPMPLPRNPPNPFRVLSTRPQALLFCPVDVVVGAARDEAEAKRNHRRNETRK